MAITSRELRGRLEDAYAASAGLSQNATSLRSYLRTLEQSARAAISAGSVRMSSGDGKSIEFAGYGTGEITPAEVVEIYRTLVDRFDDAFLFLTNCAKFGLDAFVVEFSSFPTVVHAASPAVIVDNTSRWADLCTQFGIAANLIVGAAVSDKAVFLWMMFHEVAATESAVDMTLLRVGSGASFS